LAQAPIRPIVVTCADAPADRQAALARVADVVVHGDHQVDLPTAISNLRDRGIGHILCEGGPHLFGALTVADLIDDMCLTVSPMLAGPGANRITAGAEPALRRLTLAHVLSDDDTLVLRYVRRLR
jgi:riboflavin biosynthesis pyrimidine reductase